MDAQLTPTCHYIDGNWSAGDGATFTVHSPYDDAVVAAVSAGGPSEATAAVTAAASAFPAWAETSPLERQRLFLAAADVVERRAEEVVRTLALETGSGAPFARFQIQWSANLLRQAAGWAYRPYGELLRSDVPGRTALVTRKPLGVVAGFTPWNGAFNLAWRTIVLPLAFGNTVVIKPSEEAPISAGLLPAEILDEAGFPPGTVNVVAHAPGDAPKVADVFFANPAVRCINFTGSAATARILAEAAGRALKPIVLELGGFNPMLVLADADLGAAVDATVFGAFFHQGQICLNTRKVLVEEAVHDEFLERLVSRTESLAAGDPADPATVIGPLINDRAVAQMQERIADAVQRGARLVTGGEVTGRVFAPTILADVPAAAAATRGDVETFGPLLVVESVADPARALAGAHHTPYGLSAAIMTGDENRGLEMAQRFDAGMVHINGPTMAGEPSQPNGGVKDSGWGRSGYYAIEDFTEIRLVTLTQGAGRYPI